MSTYHDRLLAARFAALAPEPLAGDWAAVVGRLGSARNRRLRPGRLDALQPRRRRRLVALAAVAFVVVVSASALAVRAFFIDKGFIGIPPVGATPSTPKSGELVLHAFGYANGSRTRTWVYADGRLIWWREHLQGNDLPVSANRNYTGLHEQRLTQRGVSLLRSEALSTGLFGHGLRLTIGNQPCFNTIEVRNGDRLVPVIWQLGCPGQPAVRDATPKEERTLLRLVQRLTHPTSWLPARAWRSRQTRAYVPREFELWYGAWPRHVRFADILKPLPAPARSLFRSTKVRRTRVLVGEAGSGIPTYAYRVIVTTEKARSLRAAFADAGLEVDLRDADSVLDYRVEARDPIGGAISVYFHPILPHGEPFLGGG